MADKIEDILGKKTVEIPLRDDTQEMLEYAAGWACCLSLGQVGPLYRRFEAHYRTLAQLDGIRRDMSRIADYFASKAKDAEEAEARTE